MKTIDYSLKISLDGFKVVKLSNDQTFNEKVFDFHPIAEKIKQIKFNQNDENLFDWNKDFGLFIMTDGAKVRQLKIHEAFECRFPVLLEGPTGTSKTRSVQILSSLLDSTLIRFNLSSETTTEDLLGRLSSDKQSWGGFSFKEGPFIDAFVNGKWLLLDEINLAPQSILQCMEAALDSHQIFLEISGKGIIKYKEHPNFRIIATQNPNDGKFQMKRETLATKFLSRFIPVEFPEIQKDELFVIAQKQAEFFHYDNKAFVKDLIEFHHEWSHREDVQRSSACFTIREITAAISTVQKYKNQFDAIMTIYGIRYPMEIREEMFKLIKEKYPNLLSEPSKFEIPKGFPKCFPNKNLINSLKYIDMAFQNKRHVLLIGKEGSGLTQIGRWVAEHYSTSEDGKKHDYCFICTPETTISDWIGRMIPVPKNKAGGDLIIWNDGPLVKSIKNGFCIYFDSLSECPPKVSEKLNGLLDPKIMEGDMIFDIPENPKENQIDIHPNFKLIASCTYDKLDSISPALLNRFNLVYLDDQLYELEDESKKELVTFLFNQELSKSIKFDIPPDMIEKLNESLDIKVLSMSKFAEICKSTARIMPYCNGLDSTTIINFIKTLLDSQCQECQVPEKLKKNLLSKFTSNQSGNEEPFYYQDSDSLKNLMAILMACSIIRKHICLVGATGLGKTSMAVAFSEKTSKSLRRGPYPYQLYSFNMESQIEDIYGTFSIDKGKPKIAKGPLYHALEKGLVYIADEFNLAEDSTIQSLAVGLESSSGSRILIPGIGKSVKCNKKFMFIACQNDIKTAGRKMLPPNIAKKLRIFTYPSATLKDLETNCRTIAKTELLNSADGAVTQGQAEQIAIFINDINNSKIPYIDIWSMRDVRKLFRRMSDALINPKKYLNFKIIHHIIFYIMTSIPEDSSESIFDSLMNIIAPCFGIDSEEAQYYKDCYFKNPEFEKIGEDTYLKKGDIGVLVPKNIIDQKISKETQLYSLWNTLFKILIAHYKEPILIAGNSGFKTFLASLVEPNAPIISLHQDTSISQLLGSIVLLNSKKAKEFCLEEFCKILQIKSEFQNLLLMFYEEMDIPLPTNSNSDSDDETSEKKEEEEKKEKEEKEDDPLDGDFGSDMSIDFGEEEEEDNAEENNDSNNKETNNDNQNEKTNDNNDNKNENNDLIKKDNKIVPTPNDHLSKFGNYLHYLIDIHFVKNAIPESFKIILEHLINIIIEPTEVSNDDNGLGDFTTVFKPGLFTNAVFEQYPLIMKDLTNLPPAVIEKFNPFFNSNPSLSLTEDISDTFTTSNTRNLNSFSNNFRAISLCSADAVRNLSDALRSRITVITCPGYSDTERNNAILSISSTINNSIEPANKLMAFSEKYYEIFYRYLPFPYLTKILQMINMLGKNNDLPLDEMFIISIFRIICSSLKDPANKIKIIEIFENMFNKEINNYKALINNSFEEKPPFYQKVVANSNRIFSSISNISIPCPETKLDQSNISFVSPFVDMVDSIFTGLSIHYPVIIEGISGKGKHTAIKYIADILGYKVITFGISSATTAEDLFCKTIPTRKNGKLEFIFTPSQILNLINAETCDDKTIIVLEEINQASSALLEAMSSLFDSSKSTILLPNGDIIQKGKYNIIALYDPSSQTIGNGLPNSFKINSIYHTVPQYSIQQINKIALKMFNVKEFSKDQKNFMNYFHIMSGFSPKSSVPELYTLNDIHKYQLFTDEKFVDLETSVVANMILLYKYSQKEDIDDATALLKIDITDLWPKFFIENDEFCATLTTKENKSLSININPNHINKSLSAYKNISSLTLHQRNCLLLLMCSVISKQASIILGPTASGKSYLVKYFAKLLGKKLTTIQVNNDTGISTLTGQFAPSASLSEDDINEISNCLKELCTIDELKNEIIKILDINDYHDWNPLKIEQIENVVTSSSYKEKFSNELQILTSKCSFISHLKQEDSACIKAMQQGNWLLIDGIESAPKELFDKIISLCSNNPILNLYERGPEYIYSRDASGEFKIHDDFRLFITYNPYDIEPSKRINPSILNKFVTFVLQPIDVTNIMSAIVLHGLINDYLNKEDLNTQISARLANVHEYAKNYSYKEPKQFAAFNKFTGRSLLFNTRIIQHYSTNTSSEVIAHLLYKCLQLNYCNSHKKPEEFYNELLMKLLEEPKLDLLQSMKKDIDLSNEKYKNILIDLYQLQTIKNDSDFKLKNFFMKMLQFEIGDIYQLIFHIADTLDQIDTPELVNKYGNLSILLQFLTQLYEVIQTKKIKKSEYSAKINDKAILKNAFSSHSVSQIYFIQNLIEGDILIEHTPLCFYSPSSQKALNEISNLLIDFDFNKLISIISIILKTPSIYYDATNVLNCNIIYESKFSNVLNLLPLFIQLQECQIPFSINKKDFLISIGENDYQVEFSISENNFDLNKDCKIFYKYKLISIDPSRFYSATCYLVDCNKKKIEPQFEKEFPTISYPKISKINNPLYSLFPNKIKNKILILLKAAILLDYPVNNNLSKIFGKFETELITLLNEIWNKLFLDCYISAIKLIRQLIEIENKIPNLFDLMNKDFQNLQKSKSILGEIKSLIGLFKDIINDSSIKFLQIDKKQKKKVEIGILKTTLQKWIEELESKKEDIETDSLEQQYKEESKEIKKNRKNLIKKLNEAINKFKDKDTEILFDYKNYLEHLEITQEKFDLIKQTINYAELNVERMINYIENTKPIERVGNIPFPIKTNIQSLENKYDIHVEICTIFLEYSETLKLLDNIQNNRELMYSVFELSHNSKLKQVIEELSQYLFSNSSESTDSSKEKYINNVKSFARALTIKQILSLNNEDALEILTNPEKLKDEFEKFINRNEINDYLELWAGEISLKYDPKDIIYIPKYTPADIQALFINKKLNNDLYDQENSLSAGILYSLALAPSPDLLNRLSKLECQNYKTLVEYLDEVSKITLEILFDQHVENDFEKAIIEENLKYPREVADYIIKLYPICKAQDSREPIIFSLEDLFFLRPNWTKEINLCAKYPSLTYWLISYPECQRKLRFYLNDLKCQEDSLPLFLHILRIFSSMNCIEFKLISQTDTSKQLSKIILEYLKPKLKNNNTNSMKWLNLLLPNIPIDFYDSEISLIHDFIKSLSQNTSTLKSELCQECQENLFKTIINEMIDSIFEDQIHLYFNDEIKNQFSSFIKNPHELIKQKIEQALLEEQQNVLKIIQTTTKKMEKSIKTIRDIIQNDDINKSIQEDIKEKINNKLETIKNTKDKIISDKIKVFQTNVSIYQQNYKNFYNYNLDLDSTVNNNNLKQIIESKDYFQKQKLDKIFDKTATPLTISYLYDEINKIYIYLDPNKDDGDETNESEDEKEDEKEDEREKNIVTEQIDSEDDEYDIDDKEKEGKLKEEKYKEDIHAKSNPKSEIQFLPLSDDIIAEISQQFEEKKSEINKEIESQRLYYNKNPPELKFLGNIKLTQKNYSYRIQTIFDNCNTFLTDVLYNKNISQNFFEKLQGKIDIIIYDVNQVKEVKSAQFHDDNQNKDNKTTNIIEQIKTPIENFDTNFKEIKIEVKKIISKKSQIKIDIENSLIPIKFAIPNIKIEKGKKTDIYPTSFDKINQSKLATPFISVSPSHELICCIKPFNPIIGPLIPDLYENERVFIKILSFVPQEIRSSINMDDDCTAFAAIPSSPAYNPIKISFTIPPYNDNVSKEINYSGNLEINSNELNHLTLPCQFTLRFLPLKIIIDSPDYQLIYINDAFRICCNKFTPNQEINLKVYIPHFQSNHNFTISKKSFPDNKAKEPLCSIDNDGRLSIHMPQNKNKDSNKYIHGLVNVNEDSSKYIHGLINVNILPNLSIPFEINAHIKENNLEFHIYDPLRKGFYDNISVFCQKNTSIKYYCYINANFEIQPQDVEENLQTKSSKNVDIKIGEIQKNRKSLIYFNIEIIMMDGINNKDSSFISLKIKEIQKIIKINFMNKIGIVRNKKEIAIEIAEYDNIQYKMFNYESYGGLFVDIQYINKKNINYYLKPYNPIIIINKFETFIFKNPNDNIDTSFKIEYQSLENLPNNIQYYQINQFKVKERKSELIIKNIIATSKISQKYPNILGYLSITITIPGFVFNSHETYHKWFPLCNEYNAEVFDYLDLNSNDDDSMAKAEENLSNFLMQLCSNLELKFIEEELNLDNICKTILLNIEKIPVTNFAPIAASIIQKDFNFESFKSIPSDILQELSIEKNTKFPNEPSLIYLHNFIMHLYSALHQKYLELEKYNFYLFLQLKWEYIEKIRKMSFEKEISTEEQFLNNLNYINKLDELSSNIKQDEKGTRSNVWICTKNTHDIDPNKITLIPKPVAKTELDNDNDINVFKKTSNEISSDSANLINNITQSLEIPDLSSVQTIEEKIKALIELTNVSQSLPFSLFVLKTQNEGTKKIEDCFNSLAQVYFQCISYKSSILESHIKSFTNSFEHLFYRLSQSGVKFDGIKKHLLTNNRFMQNIQDYIEIPDPIMPPASINYWDIYKYQIQNKYSNNYTNFNYVENKNEPDNITTIKKHKSKNTKTTLEINLTESQIKENEAIKSYSDELIGEMKEDKKIVRSVESTELKGEKKGELSKESLEKVRNDFKGKSMIEGIVSRIKNFKLSGSLPLPEEFPKIPPSQYLTQKYDVDDGSEALPIKKMIDLTDHLTSLFIQNAIDSECSLKNTCGIILIECSQTLSPQNKLSCVMLATSIARTFNFLEMPYSVVVFADYNFQFEIKKFDEIHSEDIIQKILDCVMVERFAPRIADACNFAKKKLICPNRSNRAFFIISDGLDPYMNYTDDWKKNILNDEQDSFAFFILRSAYLNDEQYKIVNKMWEDFNQGANDSVSLTRYIEFTSDSIFTGNANISIKLLLEPLKNSSKNDKYEFQNPVEYKEEINKLAIQRVEANINSCYDEKMTDIYIKDDDISEQSKGISFPSFQITSNYLVNIKASDEENTNELNKDIINFPKPKNDQWKEVIFAPNKPSQYAPSTRGTKLYLQGFIKFCITDGQENKIWLEKIAGLKRNYRITIVIDASNSCFNDLMYNHSLLTIVTFLRTLATVEIPYFDLIVATANGPKLLAVNQNTQNCLDPNSSDIWTSLFSSFEKHDVKCNLYDSILCAMKLKSTISTKKSFLFVFTDGLYDEDQQISLKNLILACRESSISVFGIGIGLYPKRINRIFQKCIWSINPSYIITALSKFFGNETPSKLKEINALFGPPRPDINDIKTVITKICDKYTIAYKSLYKYLYDQTLYKQSCPDYQEEAKGIDSLNSNPNNSSDSTMYKENSFNTQKILICAYWSKSIAGKDESEWVDPMYLTQRYDQNNTCVSEVLEYYGFEVKVVQSYKSAINELKSGQYIEAWIICGDSNNRLPDENATKNGEAYLVDQFVDCVELFWKSGGSVAWWCDNDPLFFQANIFLERAEFPGEVRKTNLRLVKGYDGLKYMEAGDISKVKKGVFDNQREINYGKYIRPSVSHNLVSLSEGFTISRANDPNNMAPFKPFAYDSQGGVVSLYYDSRSEDKCGDIWIDCGFTKLFNELKFDAKDGTIRYVQNIAARMAQYEKHLIDAGEDGPRIFKPAIFNFTINESKKFDRITSPDFDIIYMIDATGSMGSTLRAAAEQCINISRELKEKLPNFDFQFGAIFYRDPVDSPSDEHETFLLTTDIGSLQRYTKNVSATGGADGPEDWVGAYQIALDQINWRKGVRLIIHMADAPAHGHSYCGRNNHEEENDKLAPLLRRCCSSGIKIVGMPIGGDYSLLSYQEAERNYNCESHPQKFYQIQRFNSGSSNISNYFKDQIVHAAVCAAPKS